MSVYDSHGKGKGGACRRSRDRGVPNPNKSLLDELLDRPHGLLEANLRANMQNSAQRLAHRSGRDLLWRFVTTKTQRCHQRSIGSPSAIGGEAVAVLRCTGGSLLTLFDHLACTNFTRIGRLRSGESGRRRFAGAKQSSVCTNQKRTWSL